MPPVEASQAPAAPDCGVIELRQYTLHPGRREALIALFDREFVETQEAVGIRVLGQFRDADDAERFVWLRGYADMAARGRALPAFYDGPVWAAHRDAANATMVDSDDVLLLRPAWPGAALPARARASGAVGAAPGVLRAVVVHLKALADDTVLAACCALPAREARLQACYVTEPAPNNFPRHPLRAGEPVLLALAGFAEPAQAEAWALAIDEALQPWQARATQHLRLLPTSRSALRP
ncbi:MAG: NIPSNAP family protein [Pelomonas sp.]|nr:NIPSNAP family protein [Roseateles sp.]